MYLAQIALATWYRDPETLSHLEAHEMKYFAVSAFDAGFDWTPFHRLELTKLTVHMTQTKNILEDVTMQVFLLFGLLES